MINLDKLSLTSIELIHGYNNAGECEFILDEVSDTTISNTEDKVDITGKGGRKIGSLKRNKAVNVKGTNGVLVGGLLRNQTGGDITDAEGEDTKVRIAETLVVTGDKAVTSQKAVGTAGNEILTLNVKVGDSLGKGYTQNASAAAGKFAYAPATMEITFAAGEISDGTEIIVFYDAEMTARKVTNPSDTYSKKLKVYMDCMATDTCDNLYRIQFVFPRADFTGNFDLTLGDNPATHAFEFDSIAGTCGQQGILWDCIVFGA